MTQPVPPTNRPDFPEPELPFFDEVELTGHIIDSLILPKILDRILDAGGRFRILNMAVGHARHDPSFARVRVSAPTAERLAAILAEIHDHGALPIHQQDAELARADLHGAFPEGFYSSTNQRTEIRLNGQWIPVDGQEMDCGIVVDLERRTACCIPMTDVVAGLHIVMGHRGVRVFPETRAAEPREFEFMASSVSTEKPKGVAVRLVADDLFRTAKSGGKTLLVGGPAIVHTGSSGHVAELIRRGYFHRLFAGNALATHDIEQAMFGTSLGVDLGRATGVDHGHEHHLRAINRVRRHGGIANAVQAGAVTSGIMYECVTRGVPFLLAGSIRDDGPLTDVVTDSLVAQRMMREQIRDVSFCLMIATTLHSIAVGNLLPARVKVACVDINPSTVIKLGDRGSSQTVGLVTDVEPFLRSLLDELRILETRSNHSTD